MPATKPNAYPLPVRLATQNPVLRQCMAREFACSGLSMADTPVSHVRDGGYDGSAGNVGDRYLGPSR